MAKTKQTKKTHTKPVKEGDGVRLVGSPEALISLLIKDAEERKWVNEQLVNEGPAHKQVLSALLSKRLFKLVQTIEKSKNIEFVLQKGFDIIIKRDEEEMVMPLSIPIVIGLGKDKSAVVKAISHAPEHEALIYAMCLQVIEWTIKVMGKSNTK